MPVTVNAPAPYAPPSAVLEVITRHRTRGLPTPINAEVLARAGISDSLVQRTLQALQILDIIDEKGAPTKALEELRLAPEGEFKAKLAQWLNRAYADVLAFIDPAHADETAIRDAFRLYNPVGQQPRMVTLFQGLYAAAGIGPEKAPNRVPTMRTFRPVYKHRRAPADPPSNLEIPVAPLPPPPPSLPRSVATDPVSVLMGIMDMKRMSEAEQEAVWTLVKYLKRVEAEDPVSSREDD